MGWNKIICLLALALFFYCPFSLAYDQDTANRIQAKIAQVGAAATKIHESGGDVASIQASMQQVGRLLQSGDPANAEKILDGILGSLGLSAAATAQVEAASDPQGPCDHGHRMTISTDLTVNSDCMIGGDLTVTGNAVLHFDYTGPQGGRLEVGGNIIVKDNATLWVEGRVGQRALLTVDNEFSNQYSITSSAQSSIKLNYVELHTEKSTAQGNGNVYMAYDAKDHSSLEVMGSMLNAKYSWLLANFHDSSKLSIMNSSNLPTENYVHDSSSVKISASGTRTGIWLDMGGAKGVLKIPDTNGPYNWEAGARTGLNVGWSLQVDGAQPGIGIEIKPDSALTVIGNGTRAPKTGELKISYNVVGSTKTLDGLKAGLQNGKISDELTLNNVQLGPIAWQIYASANADLTIKNSTINEIGISGWNAKVRVEHSVLQLAVLAALAPGSLLDIKDSEIWNQSIEAANKGTVEINNSNIHGSLFHVRDSYSNIAITGGAFIDNPQVCSENTMVDISTGQPKCDPFMPPGPPRLQGDGKVSCTGTIGCAW